ncbi:MAG: L-seryl-tRNA(Sec) selenium transferase [Candidatus Poribacteria bacterium]|nr:MAG: L-seryl-tRNA(Sec) selenium transferase [Candidatus Poribacteria bacterium]
MDSEVARRLRELPSVEALLSSERLRVLRDHYRPEYLSRLARSALQRARAAVRTGSEAPSLEALSEWVLQALAQEAEPLRRVINCTGTVTHTNLGRALLPEAARRALLQAASSYVALEYDLERGERGHRDRVVEPLLCRLTGAEAATVVNNNAAAVWLALHVLARGREVVVSRGELIEIGGSFRLPEVMAAAGVSLREVGTTNRTHPRDYEAAIGENTGLLLKVHPSNYTIEGFTRSVELEELVAIGRRHGVPVMEDLGSGALVDLSRWGLPREPVVGERIAAGADLVTFSGDKLLGGPQAGIIVGKREAIEAIRRHPMMRTFRADKLTYAALSAVLRLYETEPNLRTVLPMLQRMTWTPEALQERCQLWAATWRPRLEPGILVAVEPCSAQIGSGAQPTARLSSWAITLRSQTVGPDRLAAWLRDAPTPVVGRIEGERLWLDLRTVADAELPELDRAITFLGERHREVSSGR